MPAFPDSKVAIIGCGYVGLTLAVSMAHSGFTITGFENHPEIFPVLAGGKPHFLENSLDPMLTDAVTSGKLKFKKKLSEGTDDATVFIITVGTPIDDQQKVRVESILGIAEELAKVLRDGDLVILRSTVKLGTTRDLVLPILQKSGKDFDLAFCPERTLQGHALAEIKNLPQIVSGNSVRALERASRLFQRITTTVVAVSALETAELIKLVDNTHRDVLFAFSNELASLCDAYGLSAVEVLKAGRIGYPRHVLQMPGPVGGPCLSKDPHIFMQAYREKGIPSPITAAARATNEGTPAYVASRIKAIAQSMPGFAANPRALIAGLAFKGIPETDDLRGTMALPVLQALRTALPGAQWQGWDPIVPLPVIANAFNITPALSFTQAAEGASLIVICNNHPFFGSISPEQLAKHTANPCLIYDLWNHFDRDKLDLPQGVRYAGLGSTSAL